MADGYGFGGEGDWKTSVLLRATKAMAGALPGGTSFMEDYTYHLVPGRGEDPRRPHARGLPLHHHASARRSRSTRSASAAARTRCGCASPPTPAPAVVAGLSDLGDRFRLTVNEIDVVEPDEALPQLPVACAVWEPRPSLSTSAESWLMAGAPHHTVLSKAVGVEVLEDFAEMTGVEMLTSSTPTPPPAPSSASCAGTPPTTAWPSASDSRSRSAGAASTVVEVCGAPSTAAPVVEV